MYALQDRGVTAAGFEETSGGITRHRNAVLVDDGGIDREEAAVDRQSFLPSPRGCQGTRHEEAGERSLIGITSRLDRLTIEIYGPLGIVRHQLRPLGLRDEACKLLLSHEASETRWSRVALPGEREVPVGYEGHEGYGGMPELAR
jgi:hypothetical protein